MWVILATLVLILVDIFTPWLRPVKAQLSSAAVPFYWVGNVPARVSEWGQENFVTREQLLEENQMLKQELLILERKLNDMVTVNTENVRLRQLMNSREMVNEEVVVAELIGVSPDPLIHKVMVDKGSGDQVYVGQPLLDATGLMGQVVDVGPLVSHVLLITDSTHALPVEVNRNGVRAVAQGTGSLEQLELRHVSPTTDVKVGDLIVSSGLGGRFPRGYPVGRVKQVNIIPGDSFAEVIVTPMAQLNKSRHVLLVFRDERDQLAGESQ